MRIFSYRMERTFLNMTVDRTRQEQILTREKNRVIVIVPILDLEKEREGRE